MSVRISPSQEALFEMCERRWYFKYILKLPEPEYARAESGKGMHWLLKEWLSKKEPPSVRQGDGKIGNVEVGMALASIPALPVPSPHLIVEQHLQFDFGGVTYHGYADVQWYTKSYGVTHDHKSTSSLVYAKTEEDLVWDPQRIIYAYPMGRDVLSRWQYVETKDPYQRQLVELYATHKQVVDAMTWLHETHGVRIAKAYTEPEEARPQNPAACGKYGREGCPYKHRCQIDPKTRLKNIMSLEAIKKRLQAQRQEMNITEPVPPAEEPVPPPKDNVVDIAPEQSIAEQEPAVTTNPGTVVEQAGAPAKPPRKQRSDVGKPRGPRGPRESKPDPEKEDAQIIVSHVPMGEPIIFGQTTNRSALALAQVITAVADLDASERERVLNAVDAFYGVVK